METWRLCGTANAAKNSDTVVAVVDGGEVTLKRFKKAEEHDHLDSGK